MRRVLKWTVPVDDHDHPIGAGPVVLVDCPEGPHRVMVWTDEADVPKVDGGYGTAPPRRRARVYGTGEAVPVGDVHLGSVATSSGLVWHVYGSPVAP